MRKSGGNEELTVIFLREPLADPLAESSRCGAKIDRHVEDLPNDDRDELGLSVRILEVEAAEDALFRARLICLNELLLDSGRPIARLVEGFEEIPAGITKNLGFNEEQTVERERADFHPALSYAPRAKKLSDATRYEICIFARGGRFFTLDYDSLHSTVARSPSVRASNPLARLRRQQYSLPRRST